MHLVKTVGDGNDDDVWDLIVPTNHLGDPHLVDELAVGERSSRCQCAGRSNDNENKTK